MVTDGIKSYAVFNYSCGNLNYGDNAVIGFKAYTHVEFHPLSFNNATKVACLNSTTLLLYDLTPNVVIPTGELNNTILLRFPDIINYTSFL